MNVQQRIASLRSWFFLLFLFLDKVLIWSLFGFLDGILSLVNELIGIGDAFSSGILLLFKLIHHVSDVTSLHGYDLFLSLRDLISLFFLFTFLLFLLRNLSLLGVLYLLLSIFFLFFLSLFLFLLFLDDVQFCLFEIFNSLFFGVFFVDLLLF